MKKINTILLFIITSIMMTACSDDIFNSLNVPEGKPVTLSLSYKELAPKVIEITRAADDKEKHLQNLQIFVFSASSGKLKGYKFLDENDPELTQEKGTVTIKTTSGSSYIYAVANARTGTYPIGQSPKGLVLPADKDEAFDEDDVQTGGKQDITRDDFMKIPFNRVGLDITQGILMSGSLNNGNPCTISQEGTVTDGGDNTIHLRRVVSKITFLTKVKTGDGVTRTFTPTSYDVVNIPKIGNLMEGAVILDGQEADNNFETIDNYRGEATGDDSGNTYIAYLPENQQTAQKDIEAGANHWHEREADNQQPDPDKKFINAPEHGTYIRLNGRYTEEPHGDQAERVAYVTYYIHLGDFSKDNGYNNNEYNVHRNYAYKYTVTVAGVKNIIVEAETETDDQPGAEGLVFELKNAKAFDLDAHYEYCVMQFNQNDIKEMVASKGGYAYSIQEFGKSTGPIIVKATGAVDADENPIADDAATYNGIHINWMKFCAGGESSNINIGRGKPVAYPGVDSKALLSLNTLLKTLAAEANDDSKWPGGVRTYTCFLNENYYKDLKWNTFTNINPRRFIIANDIQTSKDRRSTYAQVRYSVSQEAIQTFYNPQNADLVNDKVVFGIEAKSNELAYENSAADGKPIMSIEGFRRTNSITLPGSMEGRKGTIEDQGPTLPAWQARYDKIYQACLSRNRDLNGDGRLEDNEIKWYTPTIAEYSGMWIGTQALKDKLFEGSMSQWTDYKPNGEPSPNRIGSRHYYTSSNGKRIYWAEEGMAFSNKDYATEQNGAPDPDLKYLRCIRNIKSDDTYDEAFKKEPVSYIKSETTADGHIMADLSYIDNRALKQGIPSTAPLSPHTEIETGNKPFPKFEIAKELNRGDNGESSDAIKLINGSWNCSNFQENGKGWRVPNQRELTVMYLLNTLTGQESSITKSSDTKKPIERLFWYYSRLSHEMKMAQSNGYNFGVNLRCIREK